MSLLISGDLRLAKSFTQWTPSLISTALWLDAADASTISQSSGAVSQWNDKSGNGRNFTQVTAASRPAYTLSALNGLAAVTPDGSNDWMTGPVVFPGTTPNDYFVIAALRVLNIIDSGDNTANNLFFQTASTILNTNMYLNLAQGGSNYKVVHDLFPPTGGSLVSATTVQPNTSYIFAASRISGTRAIWINASTDASQSGAESYTGPAVTATDLFMLRGTNNALNAHVGEIVMLAYPTDANRQRIEGYLAHKWGLTANLPNTHPYKYQIPTPGT